MLFSQTMHVGSHAMHVGLHLPPASEEGSASIKHTRVVTVLWCLNLLFRAWVFWTCRSTFNSRRKFHICQWLGKLLHALHVHLKYLLLHYLWFCPGNLAAAVAASNDSELAGARGEDITASFPLTSVSLDNGAQLLVKYNGCLCLQSQSGKSLWLLTWCCHRLLQHFRILALAW